MSKNIPESNRRVFAIAFIVALVAIGAFIGYVRYDARHNSGEANKEVMAENPNPETVFDAPFVKANLYYIDLEKFAASSTDSKAIGCGDGILSYEIPIAESDGLTKGDALSYVLGRLFNNEIFNALKKENASSSLETGAQPYNALSKSKLRLESVKEIPGDYQVYLAGTLSLGGVCDNPRVEAELTKTISQIFSPFSVAIFLNNKPLKEALSLK